MASYFISSRGITLIILGIAGSLLWSLVVKAGVYSDSVMTTFLFSEIINLICFVAIIVGISFMILDFCSARNSTAEMEITVDTSKLQTDMSSREMKSLKLYTVSIPLSVVIMSVLDLWKLGSRDILLFTGVFCAVFIASFSLIYIIGYYIIYKPR